MATIIVFVDAVVLESVVVVVEVVCEAAVLAGVKVEAGVAALAGAGIFCEASASRITNAARKSTIAFQTPSGKGPDRFSFQSSSICRSQMSHCVTVLSDMACCLCK